MRITLAVLATTFLLSVVSASGSKASTVSVSSVDQPQIDVSEQPSKHEVRKKKKELKKAEKKVKKKVSKLVPRLVTTTSTGGDRCGEGYGKCPGNYCCSKWGWCDNGSEYCGKGCQSDYGRCDDDGGDGGDDGGNGGPARVITQCTVPGTMAITFDDGPADTTEGLLDQLDQYGIKATFFLNGDNYLNHESDEWKRIVRRIYDAGHQVGSHTFSHINLSKASKKQVESEMDKLDAAVKSVIGVRPIFMRPPYGDVNDDALAILGRKGYKVINWSIETADTEHNDVNKSVAAYVSVLKRSDPSSGGPIGLEHDPQTSTATQLVPRIIPLIKKYGFRPVTVAECLNHRGSPYRA